jgi:PAS domain S-box-containing protein
MTERDRLERELRDSEARYRTLSQSSPDLVFATDADGRYVFMNDRGAEVLGWRPEDLLGHHFSEFVSSASGDAASQSYRAVLADPSQVIRSQLAFVDIGGREVPLEIHVTGNVENGVLTSIHGVARDIRERERLERELRDSEARYRFLLENSPDVVFSTDRDGTFAFLSDGIVGLTGYTPAEVVGRHFNELIHADSIADSEARWREVNEDPSVVQQAVIDLRSKSGARVPVEVKSTGIVDEDGRFAGLHGSARDISERVRLEQDLRRQAAELAASDERAHLARELHDSVTQALFSMTLVSRTVELLLDRDPSAARNQLATLRDLQREALAEMRALIFELRPGNLEENGLIPSLRTHSAALQGRIGLPILVDSRIEGRLPIEIENVLYRIAQEALHNVVKHAGARQVRIGLARAGGGVRLTITDDGRGFDPGTVPDGHMGLTGMRARAERIGAAFGVESIPGEGTTITITVPELALAAPPGPALKTAAGGRRESAE